jgi:hypothetical protein
MKLNQSPRWRWLRAKELVDKKLPPRRSRDDKFVTRAWRYLRRYRRDDPRVEEQLATEYPDLHQARLLFEDVAGSRWVFEAGVMAGQDLEFLAEYLHAEIDVLSTYEKMFFDVRDALPHKGCITANVLLPAFTAGMRANDPDFMWKLVAYEGGWEAAKSIWEIGEVSPVAMDFIVRTFREQVMKVARNAAFFVQPNNFNSVDLMGKGIDMLRLDLENETSQGATQSEASISALLESVNLSVRKTTDQIQQVERRRMLPDASSIFAISKEKTVEAQTVDEESK